MKIAFLSFYNGQINRGVETVVKELANRLSKNNEVIVFQSAANNFGSNYKVKVTPTFVNWDIKDKTTSIRRRLFIDYWSLKIAIFTLKTIPNIFKEKYDIVIPFNGGWQVALIRMITWFNGTKMVIAGQTGIGWDEKNNLMSFPDCYVGLSSKSESWARIFNPLIRTTMIPNGVNLEKFNSEGISYKTDLKKPIILVVGAFTEQKRLDLTIKAVSKIKDASLLIVGGGGELKDKIQDFGTRLVGDRFQVLSVPFENMPEIYRAADVFTLPSASSEAFGNVLVEAMASGLPVVATDDPIRKEIVGDAGILVDPTNTEEYAKALQKALDTNWGSKPRKQAEKFSWDEIAIKYEELFKLILKR